MARLDFDLFERLLRRSDLTEDGCAYVRRVRASLPARQMTGNISGTARVASFKMGFAVQAESRNYEYPQVLEYEDDDEVLEFWDQPERLHIPYQRPGTARRWLNTVCDFLVLRLPGRRQIELPRLDVRLEEVKPHDAMVERAKTEPWRYKIESVGYWSDAVIGAFTKEALGIAHIIRTEYSVDRIQVENARFLLRYRRPGLLPYVLERARAAANVD